MEINDLLEFTKVENERLKKYYGLTDGAIVNLAWTVKLSEELGELCNEVLAHNGLQRKHKIETFDPNNIDDEFADVIITTLLLAEQMGVDIKNALDNKVKKINKRYD
jgi:NTP pyrophosphatase (non-canonical NTP hydrolase)